MNNFSQNKYSYAQAPLKEAADIPKALRQGFYAACDKLLSRKRAPWTLQRPTMLSAIRLRSAVNWGRGHEGSLASSNNEAEISSSTQPDGSEASPLMSGESWDASTRKKVENREVI